MKRFFRICNLEKYQHYKNRSPEWIKLHASTLDDPDFMRLQDASKWLAVASMLLAARSDNRIDASESFLKWRLNMDAAPDLESLEAIGFIEFIDETDDSDASEAEQTDSSLQASASDLSRNACLEREREGEKEGERETHSKSAFSVVDSLWDSYPEHRRGRKVEVERAYSELESVLGLFESLEAWKSSDEWQREAGRYVPKLEKFLRERIFERLPLAPAQSELTNCMDPEDASELSNLERGMEAAG